MSATEAGSDVVLVPVVKANAAAERNGLILEQALADNFKLQPFHIISDIYVGPMIEYESEQRFSAIIHWTDTRPGECTYIFYVTCAIISVEVICLSSILATVSYFLKELFFLVSYVKNNAFPQPLSDQEEKKYLNLMAEGDEEARNRLIEHNLRLVAHIVKKFENTGEDQEDLISIGTIGLIKAIESYSQGKGTKLATYAARCIENEIVKSKGCVRNYKNNTVKNFIINVTTHLTQTTRLNVNNTNRVWGDVTYEQKR